MLQFILWYLAISLTGLLALPLAYCLLPGLADRGYTLIRTLGWLVWGFLFWLLAALGVLHNDLGGLVFAGILLAGLSGAVILRGGSGAWTGMLDWLRSRRRLVLTTEALFLAAFAGYAVVRAANPEAVGTEKPMELAFINAILRSPTLPPHDPWLSGYAISYYHFGYILVAMLARLTGTAGSVAFNLGLALVFALTAVGAFGLVYNLLARRTTEPRADEAATEAKAPSLMLALLGPLFVLVVSNLEGFLHMLHGAGVFWQRQPGGGMVSRFWSWLDIVDLNTPPAEPLTWAPTRFWWWWRASRVVQDYDLAGNAKEIIDEFPAFSFILGDLHPHVLAMPFAFLTMALALNLYLGGGSGLLNLRRKFNLRTLLWAGLLAEVAGIGLAVWGVNSENMRLGLLGLMAALGGGLALLRLGPLASQHGWASLRRSDLEALEIGMPLYLSPATFLLAAVAFGGAAFLNIWDFPTAVALFAGAYILNRARQTGWKWGLLKEFLALGLALGTAGFLLYLPFFLSFASQAGGPLPNLIYPTRGAQLWVMFGTLFLPLFALLGFLLFRGKRAAVGKGLALAAGFSLALWVLALLFGALILVLPGIGDFYLGTLAAPDRATLFSAAFTRRLTHIGGLATLIALVGLTLALLIPLGRQTEDEAGESADRRERRLSPGTTFALLMALMGGLLVLGPEFFYLRDNFGWRMNTIFKFYFQAWQLLGAAAAYAAALLVLELRRGAGLAFRLGLTLLLAAGLVYPVFGVWSKTNGFQPDGGLTLDSADYMYRQSENEMAAINWLKRAPPGIIVEAVGPGGGSYSTYARVSTLSGLPTVLGWVGHEGQWRGGYTEIGSRQADVERLYCSRNWQEAQAVLAQYDIRYVFVGPQERAAYQPGGSCPTGLNEGKFQTFLEAVFQQGDVTVYAVPVVGSFD